MRALFLSAALISAALSGCVRCCVPLNAPPYDPTQWGWGPQDRFCVTRSYYGFAKDYPGVHPYYMVPPGAPPRLAPAGPACVRLAVRPVCRSGRLKRRWAVPMLSSDRMSADPMRLPVRCCRRRAERRRLLGQATKKAA